ncbi:hypothetical protein HNY73_003995 [Argiope bruennichi]|uniref:NADH dehydrogenase [ubiquinone] 1 alpha subcomplex assembly factor 2 n=2 Tax=Argiope bruennichi TaxID=94029 RepID=A0A8T0FMH5_ARGBR|nr:hypothetical protein HNY73_003995 [Argiope bruennichi]
MRKAGNRWFEPKVEGEWQQNLPAEWEAWLRGRRRDAPTEEEVMQNLALAQTKKIKGDEIAARDQAASHSSTLEEKPRFPKLEDYEKEPGQFSDRKTY